MTDLYQSQRAMRNMRRTALQRGVIAILDVGTSKIACLILRFDGLEETPGGDGVGSMAGQSNFRVIGAATTKSRGRSIGCGTGAVCEGGSGTASMAVSSFRSITSRWPYWP